MLPAPSSQYVSSTISWCWQTSVYMLLLFPEGSCYLLPSVPKPPHSHFFPLIPLHQMCWNACPTRSFTFRLMGARNPCHCDFYLHSGWAIRCLPMKTDLEQNWIQWNALGPTDSDWCRMSPRLSPWKMRLAKDLPCEQYNVSPCIGDSVQGTAEIWTSPQLEVYISIAILQNMCFGACWEKGFIFSSFRLK